VQAWRRRVAERSRPSDRVRGDFYALWPWTRRHWSRSRRPDQWRSGFSDARQKPPPSAVRL